jgi:sporulation protein YlmC with PRC-barrel domain
MKTNLQPDVSNQSNRVYAKSDSTSEGPGPRVMGATTLVGNEVCDRQDENLGKIHEIMLDTATGHVAYAVLAAGGFLGVGDKYFAIPWEMLELDTDYKQFTLNISKDELKQAPGFDKDHWPSMADTTWAEEIHGYYKTTPYWERN